MLIEQIERITLLVTAMKKLHEDLRALESLARVAAAGNIKAHFHICAVDTSYQPPAPIPGDEMQGPVMIIAPLGGMPVLPGGDPFNPFKPLQEQLKKPEDQHSKISYDENITDTDCIRIVSVLIASKNSELESLKKQLLQLGFNETPA